MKPDDSPAQPERREFLTKAASVGIGAAIGLVPMAAGLLTVLDPLRKRGGGGGAFLRVASLGALPEDGSPRQFPVVSDRVDAWNKYPQIRVGAVYLRRVKSGAKEVQAISVVCPHAGCFVNYAPEQNHYLCPCHDSTFAPDGTIKSPSSPSPRALDTLEVRVNDDGSVWVKFQNFRPGTHEKIAVS